MALMNSIYNGIFRRTSTYVLAIMAGAFLFERTFDIGTDKLFEKINEGKLYKDVEARRQKAAEEE